MKLTARLNNLVLLPLLVLSFSAWGAEGLRPPSVPLVACDPYFSIWSPGDRLTDVDTTHWTGRAHRLTSLLRIDGQTFRLMGKEPGQFPALPQKQLTVLPTRTIYNFEGQGISLEFTFTTPALPSSLDILSRPVTYLTWKAKSMDGKTHQVSAYLDANTEISVNEVEQNVTWNVGKAGNVNWVRVGSEEQPVLQKKGDDLRIDWGSLYLAQASGKPAVAPAAEARERFARLGQVQASAAPSVQPARSAPVLATAISLGDVSAGEREGWAMLAYDDLYSIQYMKRNLRPYWRRHGWEAADLLRASAKDYASLQKQCARFDEELMTDMRAAGGEKYAEICALAYRQCFAAGKFVADANGQPLSFCKENHSNGCIGTSDVFYPMAPQFLLFGPSLAKSFLVPFLNYAASERWKFPFAPHDLGTYPKANGQVYGGGERNERDQMPVEESGNLLLLVAAVAEMEGNAKFATPYWPQLERWAEYLKAKGFDPENQLCTDDFAGHLAHNVNLSAKAICGLGAFGKLCQMRGEAQKAEEYFTLARSFAQRWVKEAADGDHYRLAFDRSGTWSQKYNLVWDRILGLNLFPAEVLRTEMDYYRKIQNKYGIALDNRKTYTKLDWILWTATLTQNRDDFEALISPVHRFLNETPDRSPMTDWYQVPTAKKVGFTARPVVGGVFLQALYDKQLWHKWAGRDKRREAQWAAMPKPPVIKVIVPTAREAAGLQWNYTTAKPADDWNQPSFASEGWKTGEAGFGTENTPGAVVRTRWNTGDIWLRREFSLDRTSGLTLWLHHDEDAEVYINGVLAAKAAGFVGDYDEVPLTRRGADALKTGKNTIAIHCHQTRGGQYIDAGFVEITRSK